LHWAYLQCRRDILILHQCKYLSPCLIIFKNKTRYRYMYSVVYRNQSCGSGLDPDPWARKWSKNIGTGTGTLVHFKFTTKGLLWIRIRFRSALDPDSLTLWIRIRTCIKSFRIHTDPQPG
jgi:hypothetical protein